MWNLIRKGYVLMKKEIKGFVCGVLSTVIMSVGIVSASGIWENIPVLRNDIFVDEVLPLLNIDPSTVIEQN